MKALGSALVAILIGLVALVLLVKLVFFAFKLIGIVIAIGIAVVVYLVIEKMVRGGRHA
jgi:hypothetical protein